MTDEEIQDQVRTSFLNKSNGFNCETVNCVTSNCSDVYLALHDVPAYAALFCGAAAVIDCNAHKPALCYSM
jgi:hypothetical protein